MELAARMAERAQGSTSPNPPVGALIVKNGIILSRGYTQPGGKPHAEIDAISKVKNKKNSFYPSSIFYDSSGCKRDMYSC